MNKQQLASKIWASANRMRSKIEANDYKDYILGFIFYKFLSDKEEVHISVIPTQRFRSYPPSVFTDTWLSFANLLFLSQTLSFNIKTM